MPSRVSAKRITAALVVAARSLSNSLLFWRKNPTVSITDGTTPAGHADQSPPNKVSGVIAGAKISASTTARAIADGPAGAVGAAAEKAASGAKEALGAGKGAVQSAAQTVPGISNAIISGIKGSPRTVSARAVAAANTLHLTAQGVLASDLSAIANGLVQGVVKGPATIYDRAMDASFIETGIGGSHHRLFDGGHTITAAFAAARGASPDDTLVEESLGAVLGLLRDAGTPRGLPLATWNQDTFNQVAATLESTYHIPKSWFVDLNTYTGAELLGGAISAVALVFAWNRADTEAFAKLAGGIGVSSALSANPLLMLVTVIALARAFHKARRAGEMAEFVDGQARGGLVAGASFAAISAVSVGGGPVGLALLLAVVTGILVNVATNKVSVVQVVRVVRGLAAQLAAAAQGLRDDSADAQRVPARAAIGPNSGVESIDGRGPIALQATNTESPTANDPTNLRWP
ncbi:MAG: hypothetical protein OXP37_02795 [Chloroflexota bacterium]|nr:hypothetical protein [Chloroflexota bacterium]